jgi:nucleoside-diphosphate-sugar epimerase
MRPTADTGSRPLVVVTGAAGNLGASLGAALLDEFDVVGLDLEARSGPFPVLAIDFASDAAVELALVQLAARFGRRVASCIHLAAYHELSDAESPRYEAINVAGTRRLLRALSRGFEVEQFVYASTMLVHAPCRPGERIDESHPIEPRWPYAKSKARAEEVVRAEHGDIPAVIMRLAGVYDDDEAVPSLAHQIARIYERELESYLYAGCTLVGQSMLHREDFHRAVKLAIAARGRLPAELSLLIGEADAVGYDALQDAIGKLLHGTRRWPTMRMPKALAAAGAWVKARLEPVVPDFLDAGRKPFIEPFMVSLADDHYALDLRRARETIGWEPSHRLADELPRLVGALQTDPAQWYRRHRIGLPAWLENDPSGDADRLRVRHEIERKREHGETRWTHFANMMIGTWLVTQPALVGVAEPLLRSLEIALGCALIACAAAALSWRAVWTRWSCAAIGAAVMAAPFVAWTGNAAAYLSDTLAGTLVFAFAVCFKPEPGPSAVAALTGPTIPPGWSYNPSSWSQRVPIIATALIGLYVSRYLAAYQLGHIPAAWDPFFPGSVADPRNGTEEIVTSWVSEAWPFPDAAIGGYVYLLEIVTGIVGSTRRWRTMPWLVILFGLMIAPLGVTSILFIVIQPVVLGTWSTLALIGAAAILVQIPYSLDELVATVQFLRRRARAGRNWMRVLFVGDTDEPRMPTVQDGDEFDRPATVVLKDMLGGGVKLTWNLALAGAVALSLLFSRLTAGADGYLADAHHVVGSLALTVVAIAAAEVARPARFVNVLLGGALIASAIVFGGSPLALAYTVAAGLALAVLSVRRGAIAETYGGWSRRLC